ncbi:inositol monophosphatase 1-like protein [Geranomyces variabilis]|nr:inositol monophosphatase 1-like protein [Geranomyces variabilis]KAJ3136487.1 Inositol monophosphatase 2 [Geranomyces variabilis]
MPAADPLHLEFLDHAVQIARITGAKIKTAFHSRSSLHIDLKNDNDADLVTQVDRAVEKEIFTYLRSKYPSHAFVGEEGTSESGVAATGISRSDSDTPTWVVDPVDGTTNFVHGFPFVAVSIAVVVRGMPIVGVVFNPIMDEMFTAVQSGGAFLNNVALPTPPVRPLASLASALVASEYGSDRGADVLDAKFATLRDVVGSPARGVRSLGSAALTMCYVARGALDAYWEAGVHAWDVAAAAVVLWEAGGLVGNWVAPASAGQGTRETYDICARNVVCVRETQMPEQGPAIMATIRATLRPVNYARD